MIAYQVSTPESCLFADSDRDPVLDLVHDLRQSLSSIDAIACYLEMHLVHEEAEVQEYILKLQELVQEADRILSGALGRKAIAAVATA